MCYNLHVNSKKRLNSFFFICKKFHVKCFITLIIIIVNKIANLIISVFKLFTTFSFLDYYFSCYFSFNLYYNFTMFSSIFTTFSFLSQIQLLIFQPLSLVTNCNLKPWMRLIGNVNSWNVELVMIQMNSYLRYQHYQ